VFVAATTSTYIWIWTDGSGGVGSVDDISVKQVKGDHLVGYWKNTGKQKWDDLSGNDNHGTFKNHVFGNIPQTGLMSYNKPMLFDGSNDYVDCGMYSTVNYSAISISFLMYANSFGGNPGIVDKNRTSEWDIHISGTNKLRFEGRNANNDVIKFETTATVPTNELLYIVVVYTGDTSTSLIYVNGSSVGVDEVIARTGDLKQSTTVLLLGKRHDGGNFKGIINEVSIFDTALTATEVSELYGNGTPLDALEHSKVDNLQGYWRNDGDTTWTDRTPTRGAELVTGHNQTAKVVGDEIVFTNYSGPIVFTGSDEVIGRQYEYIWEITEHTTGSGCRIFPEETVYQTTVQEYNQIITSTDTAIRIYVLGWTGKLKNTFSVKEVKGGNDGEVSGSPKTILLPEARNGRDTLGFPINNVNNGYLALHGDGYVEVADDASLDGVGELTIEAWARYNGNGSDEKLLSKGINTDKSTYHIRSDAGANTTIKFQTNNGSAWSEVIATDFYEIDKWFHIVVTVAGTTVDIYKDGSVFTTGILTNAIVYSNEKLVYGARANLSNKLFGDIDEPRIYNRALTAKEVLSNYNASKSKHRNN